MDALLATAADPTTQMILGVIFCAVIVRAAFGFGDVLVSVPILTLFVGPRLVVPLMGLVGATNALLLLLAERQSVQWRPVRFLLLASVVGIPVGVGLLNWLAEDTINFGLGVVLIAFCIWSLSGRQAFRLAAPRLGAAVWILCRRNGRGGDGHMDRRLSSTAQRRRGLRRSGEPRCRGSSCPTAS